VSGWNKKCGVSGRALFAPNVLEDVDPVLAHDLAHHAFAVAAFEQGFGEVGEFAYGADAQRVDDLAEAGQAAGVALVVGQVFEEVLAMASA
jgi:hypothetical protein